MPGRLSRRGLLGAGGLLAGAVVGGCTPGAPTAGETAGGSGASPTAGRTSAGGSATTGTPGPSPTPTSTPTPTPTPTRAALPRGGDTVFPRYRLAGYCGYPGAAGQGRLGIGNLDDRVVELQERFAGPYGQDRPILPLLELIAVTVHAKPGRDGMYRGRTDPKIIDEHLAAARRHRGYLLLNIQPGRADFLAEVQALQKWLSQPDVGVALDPEWAVNAGQVPGKVYGSTTGQELDQVARWLSDLVAEHRLPEKVMAYHQLHPRIVRDEDALQEHPGVALLKSIDGIGSKQDKTDTWHKIVATTPKHVHMGFKLFYEEDKEASGHLMTPAEVLALKPTPEYVVYE